MSHDLKLIAIAVSVMVVCAPGAAYAKDPPCKQLWKVHNGEIVKGLCVRHDTEADQEVIAKKKKAAEELEKANSTPLVPIYSCSNGAAVTPDHQCRCPAGQVEGKNGLCAPVVQGQHPSTTRVCNPGQVLARNGSCVGGFRGGDDGIRYGNRYGTMHPTLYGNRVLYGPGSHPPLLLKYGH